MPRLERIVSGAVLALALAAGCAGNTASIEDTWRSPNARYGELTNVVTLSMSRNVTISRSWEDQLAAQLRKRGVRATPAYAVLTEQDLSDRNRALAALRAAGYDGVVTMKLIGKDTQLQYVPTLDAYWGYWGDAWGGEAIPETIVRIEVNAYSLHGNRLVWSGISKSTDPENLRELIGDVTTVVSRELDKEKIIPGVPTST